MEEMTTPFPHEAGVKTASQVHRRDADYNRPLELLRPREDDGRPVGSEFEQILERRLDRGEGSSMIAFDFL
jgi:hypothetical protein